MYLFLKIRKEWPEILDAFFDEKEREITAKMAELTARREQEEREREREWQEWYEKEMREEEEREKSRLIFKEEVRELRLKLQRE